MERHRLGHQRVVGDERGQATVEYALILAAFLTVVVGLGLLLRALDGGLFVEHALASASHHVQASMGWMTDVFSY